MEEAPPRGPPVSWSDIPVDLASLVLGRLPAHVDRVRFAAVCPQWRAAALQGGVPPSMPMLLLPDATVYSLPGSEPFRFPGCVGYTDACGTGNWLVFSGEDGCFLRDPFSNTTVTLPALSRARLLQVGDESGDEAGHAWMEMGEERELDAHRIMLCSPHLIAAIFNFRREGITRIAVCQPGASSWWTILVSSPLFVDIVFHKGKLYALNCMDSLFAVDISVDHSTGDPWVSQIQQVIGDLHTCHMIFLPEGVLILRVNYLVESRGALLLVCREMDLRLEAGNWDKIEVLEAEETRFEVYEANFGQSRWAMVTTLGDDQVLFLCQRFGRSVNVSHNEMPGDRIFFIDNDEGFSSVYNKGASSSCSVYDMTDGKVSSPLPMVSWKPGAVFATWLLP
ncbi:hypothetical protein SETIT_8G182500v2 [Setaria italica]|uniref:KIB1-4 beta-propeller domain-containing protein n=1 Tax=Setaria italica TaxID=4555 RepID=K3ZIR5_SETIT|nr:uncharacterized protein LOC101764971 [Setaria italica]RCV38934.1 hypothetical protein SETIT_8G182500v2 [Setaria italica]